MISASYDFTDKVTLVTGSSRGLGKGIVEKFAANGATVIMSDVVGDKGKASAQDSNNKGFRGTVTYIDLDVSDPKAIQAVFAKIVEKYGHLDYVINNAALPEDNQPITEVDDEILVKGNAVNINGPFYVTKYATRQMLKQDTNAAIVNIASLAGIIPTKGMSAYSLAKAAVIGMTKSAALDVASTNVRINAVAPGLVLTEKAREVEKNDPKAWKMYQANVPIGRGAEPSEIASAVIWLCSDEASQTTGTIMSVDGGAGA
jgi:NAD(P)-dependent dehydrogenase (short-subunit alcohol dehydrogenase family)